MNPYVMPGLKERPKCFYNGKDVPKYIVQLYREYAGYDIMDLSGKSRRGTLVDHRHLLMWLLYRYTNLSEKEVGLYFNRDRTTVIHAIAKVDENILLTSVIKIKNELTSLLESEGFEKIPKRTNRKKGEKSQKIERAKEYKTEFEKEFYRKIKQQARKQHMGIFPVF